MPVPFGHFSSCDVHPVYCAAFSVIGKCFSCIKAREEVRTAQICVVLGVFFFAVRVKLLSI